MNELLQACVLAGAMVCAAPPVCPADAGDAHAPDRVPRCVVLGNATVRANDAWLGADKFTHAAASWAATAFVFAAARSAGAERDEALLAAGSAALGAGLAKELIDRRRYGVFSIRDLVADVLGVGVAYFFLREVR